MQRSIEISLSKNENYLIIIVSILAIFVGIWLFNSDLNEILESNSIGFFESILIIKSFIVFLILLFITIIFRQIKKLSSLKTGLIINHEGITDLSRASSIGLIEWSDISKVRSLQIISVECIAIYIRNPNKYIKKTENKKESKRMLLNKDLYGTPIIISCNRFRFNSRKLTDLIQTGLKSHQNRESLD